MFTEVLHGHQLFPSWVPNMSGKHVTILHNKIEDWGKRPYAFGKGDQNMFLSGKKLWVCIWTLQGVPSGWERMPLSNPLGFKHHPLQDAGMIPKPNFFGDLGTKSHHLRWSTGSLATLICPENILFDPLLDIWDLIPIPFGNPSLLPISKADDFKFHEWLVIQAATIWYIPKITQETNPKDWLLLNVS